jgi:hypothetical protein
MTDFITHRVFAKHHKLSAIDLLGGAFASMINTNIALKVTPVGVVF